MKKTSVIIAVVGTTIGLPSPLCAQTQIVSDALGFNSVACPPESDTILAVPFRRNGSQQGALASAPVDNLNDTATLTLAGTPGFTTDEFADTHYAKFSSGDSDGSVFPITANGADTLTVFLNGATSPTAAADDTLIIAAYWTLDTLFPPADAEPDPTTTGHAIVESTSRFISGRRTEVLLPNLSSPGINLAPNQNYYIYDDGTGKAWRKVGESHTLDFGDTQLYPDNYFLIRHYDTVTSGTTFKCSGEVEYGVMAIPLSTQIGQQQDNFIGIPRPIDVELQQLNLFPGAFEPSTSRFISGRKDELIVFDNELAAFNKAGSAIYYLWDDGTGMAWRKVGESHTLKFDTDTITAGMGFMIRKAATDDGATVFWNNAATYDNQP